MENKTNLEALEKGFVESKTEKPCNNILEGADPDVLCNLSEKCTADVNSGLNKMNHDLELKRKTSYGGIEESNVIVGNNRIDKDDVESNFDVLVLTNGDNVENNDLLDLEKDLNIRWDDEKSDDVLNSHGVEPMEEDGHVVHSHEPDSPTKIEVSGSGLNLFVEVFGPLDGINDENNNVGDKDEHVLQEIDSGQKSETLSLCGENVNVIVGEEQSKFNVGDIVWVKTRSQSWWPGIISDPSNGAKDETKCVKRGSFLVKYFGNSNIVWCPNSDMKPFLEFFESMSKQNSSRNFKCSVEKALCEFGRRVRSHMTCPCFSKQSQMAKTSKFGDFSLSQFEPVNFSALIKDLARSVSIPSKIELTVVKNRLSAFYCSLGHLELPMQTLKSSSDDGDDKVASSGKSFESRERKKSKYLSFPYVDAIVAQDTQDPKHISSQPTKSTTQSSGKKTRKNGPEKPSKGSHVISKADNIDACSNELLSELYSTARDCFYLRGSKFSDSLGTFFCSFRTFAFVEADMACKTKREKRVAQVSSESEEKTEGILVAEKSVNNESSKMDNLKEKGNVVCKKAKKKKEQVISAGPESVSNSSITGLNITTVKPGMISSKQTGSDVQKSVKAPKKGKVGPTPGLPHVETINKLPNANKDQPSFSSQHMPVGETSINVNGGDQMVFKSVSSLKDVQTALQNMNNGPGINGTIQPDAGFTSPGLASNVKNNKLKSPDRKKRKRKESPCQVDTNIPDLNGNVSKNLPEGNDMSSPVAKPELKSMRNKSANTEKTGSNVKTNRVLNKVEDPGGILFLNFAQDSVIPPRETLVKTFSRFGLLKESDLQILDDLTVKVVYERSSDASFASRSLGYSKPFGESLVGFKLEGVPAVTPSRPKRKYSKPAHPPVPVDATKNLTRPLTVDTTKNLTRPVTVDATKNLTRPVHVDATKNLTRPVLEIAVMRQNVDKMKTTLEKAGNNISAEMRALLEKEIKCFLDRINSMGGSSSSSMGGSSSSSS